MTSHLVLPRMRTMEELRRISLQPDGTPTPGAAALGPGEAVGRMCAGATAVRAASDMLEVAPAFGPEPVVRECGELFGGHLLAETLGLPCATLDIGPLGAVADPGLLPALNEARAAVGLPPLEFRWWRCRCSRSSH